MDQIPGNRRDPVEGNPYIYMVYEMNRKRTGEEERNEEWYLQQIQKRLKQEKEFLERENGKVVIDNLPGGCYPAACRCEGGDGSECGTSLVSN